MLGAYKDGKSSRVGARARTSFDMIASGSASTCLGSEAAREARTRGTHSFVPLLRRQAQRQRAALSRGCLFKI